MPGGIPTTIDIAPPIVGGDAFYVTVYLDAAIDQDTHVLLTSPNGNLAPVAGVFPITVPVPAGHPSVEVHLTSAPVAQTVYNTIGAAPAGVDMSDANNWTAAATQVTQASPARND